MQDIPKDILARACAGDLPAFEVIYKATASFVYNVACRIVNNREDAEEVVQEVFLIIHNKLKGFRFESSLKTWVYRITVNCAINYAKKAARIRNKTVEYDEELTAGAVASAATEEMEQKESGEMVDKLLNTLNPDQRSCVVLRSIEGLSYQEIAETLKININTVRTRLKRAREKLLEARKQVSYEQL